MAVTFIAMTVTLIAMAVTLIDMAVTFIAVAVTFIAMAFTFIAMDVSTCKTSFCECPMSVSIRLAWASERRPSHARTSREDCYFSFGIFDISLYI